MDRSWVEPPAFDEAGQPPPIRSTELTRSDQIIKVEHSVIDYHRDKILDSLSFGFPRISRWRSDSDGTRFTDIAYVRRWVNENVDVEALRLTDEYLKQQPKPTTFGDVVRGRSRFFIPANVSVLRVRQTAYWIRDDPILQLAPGVTKKMTLRRVNGISSTESTELSRALGLEATAPVGKLSSSLSERLSSSVSLTTQHETSEEITLTNERASEARRFALWRWVEKMSISQLDFTQDERTSILYYYWDPKAVLETKVSDIYAVTHHDIP